MTDPVVEAVRADLLRRSEAGLRKYGVGLDRHDLGLIDWLRHTYEEHLDAANYLKRAIMGLEGSLPFTGETQTPLCITKPGFVSDKSCPSPSSDAPDAIDAATRRS